MNLANGTIVTHQYDVDGNRVKTTVTPQVAGTATCQGPGAVFLKEDRSAQGTWQGTYGADGQYINGETPAPPSYGSVTVTGNSDFTWNPSTTDVRALQQPPPGTSRIASVYYSATRETVHVVTTDGNPHTVAFYLLDWDNLQRAQTITAQTPSGTVLDAGRAFGSYTSGEWAVYQVCGSVDFVFTRTNGPNATLSGVFFGPPPSTHVAMPAVTSMLVDTSGELSQIVAETDAGGNLGALYVRAGDELLETVRPAQGGTWSSRFVHGDALESVRALTDESATTVDTRAYEAFGTKNAEAGTDPLVYGFAGEPIQAQSLLASHRGRWLDSRLGRFVSMDRFEGVDIFPATEQKYSYALASPTDNVDPSGMAPPPELEFGLLVHQLIEADFEKDYGACAVTDITLKRILAVPRLPRSLHDVLRAIFGASLFSRPDLVDICGRWVYEIKPDTRFDAGREQINNYIKLMVNLDPNPADPWAPGGPYVPTSPIMPYPLVIVTVDPPVNGVILYHTDDRLLRLFVIGFTFSTSGEAAQMEAETASAVQLGAMGFN